MPPNLKYPKNFNLRNYRVFQANNKANKQITTVTTITTTTKDKPRRNCGIK